MEVIPGFRGGVAGRCGGGGRVDEGQGDGGHLESARHAARRRTARARAVVAPGILGQPLWALVTREAYVINYACSLCTAE